MRKKLNYGLKKSGKRKVGSLRNLLMKTAAIASIYLILSLTIFTARTMAVLTYDISGDAQVSGYARKSGDYISIKTISDTNVSFVTGTGTSNYKETELQDCSYSDGVVTCIQTLGSQINTNLNVIPFKLKQKAGTPLAVNGQLYLDSKAPVPEYFTAQRSGNGILFSYKFNDYLSSNTEAGCIGSGIGTVELSVQNRVVNTTYIDFQTCQYEGSYYANLSGTNSESISYGITVTDRAGNVYSNNTGRMNGDFVAPKILDGFKLYRGDEQVSLLSGASSAYVDVVVKIEDSNITPSLNNPDSGRVYADLSSLNSNPAIAGSYTNVQAECTKDTGNVYICKFRNIQVRPQSENIQITVNAIDSDGNIGSRTVNSYITLKNNAGAVRFIGPIKDHCTDDLNSCYISSGIQIFRVEIQTNSSYEKSIINIGVNSQKIFGICRQNDFSTDTWDCTGVYLVPKDSTILTMAVADSVDDYSNPLSSGIERIVYVDDAAPVKVGELFFSNSNHNEACAVSGDQLTFKVNVSEQVSPQLNIYMNTTNFTTKNVQKGSCEKTSASNKTWECTLNIEELSSIPTTSTQSVIISDLAGNSLSLPYNITVCQSSSQSPPNVIYNVTSTTTPKIDRRTASILPIKTYFPLDIESRDGAKLVYLSIDRCTAPGFNGADVLSSGYTILPTYGNKVTLALNIGHKDAQLLEGSMDINCTLSARVSIGNTVYTKEEKENFVLHANTFNQPLGTLDSATIKNIQEQKDALKKLDSTISKRQKVNKLLKSICDISNILVKVDTVLQTLKAAIYAVALIIEPIYPGSGDRLWDAADPPLTKFDTFIQKYVWPTGENGQKAGYIWKVTCIIYNCRFYTLTGLIDTVSTASDILAKPSTKIVASTQDDDGIKNTVFKDGGELTEYPKGYALKYESTDSNGNFFREYSDGGTSKGYLAQDIDTGQIYAYETYTGTDGSSRFIIRNNVDDSIVGEPYDIKKNTQGSGLFKFASKNSVVDKNGNPVSQSIQSAYQKTTPGVDQRQTFLDAPEEYNKQSYERQTLFYDAVDRHDWLINPYKSSHYDGLCLPATIYNMQKERQIRCMYLSCMIDSQSTGMPASVCSDLYGLNTCLYLDSAQYRLSKNIFEMISVPLVQQSIMFTMGWGMQQTYTKVCKKYISAGYHSGLYADRGKSAACGLWGVSLKFQEIAAIIKSPSEVLGSLFKSEFPADPAEKYDYCDGGKLYAE